MKFVGLSLVLFLLSVVLLGLVTFFEFMPTGMSMGLERWLTFMLLVLPAGVGSALGAASLSRKEGRVWLATTLVVLNALFALFHLIIVLFAG